MSKELASPEQTLQIYTTLRSWLYEHGSVEADDGREIIDNHLGIHVIKGGYGIDYNFSLAAKSLGECTPEFAEAFEIGGLAVSAYFMPAFYHPPDESEACPSEIEHPKTCFYFKKNRASVLETEHLEIQDHRTGNGGFRIYRDIERRIAQNSCEVVHEEVDVEQGEPGSLTTKEYEGLKSLTYLLYFSDPESFRFEPAWEAELPNNFLHHEQ